MTHMLYLFPTVQTILCSPDEADLNDPLPSAGLSALPEVFNGYRQKRAKRSLIKIGEKINQLYQFTNPIQKGYLGFLWA